MTKTLVAVFDGESLQPVGPVDLKPNMRYLVTVESEVDETIAEDEDVYPLTEILNFAADMGVEDLSVRHDWYAHQRLDNHEQ